MANTGLHSKVSVADVTNTTSIPWYREEIGPRLRPHMRKFFETYSKVPNEELEEHLYRFRDEAWKVKTYPCIGQFQWLTSITPTLPVYPAILERVKAGDAILDLGSCFAQDLRTLAADGAPTDQMFASDIISEFWELSFKLYRDQGRMKAQFVQADVFDTASLEPLKGRIDIIITSHFLHLWNWEKQIEVAKNMVSLTKPGAWFVGYHIGSHSGQEAAFNIGGKGGELTMFLHNAKTTEKFWKKVGDELGVEISVDAAECPLTEWLEPEDFSWMAEGGLGLSFVVKRLDSNEDGKESKL